MSGTSFRIIFLLLTAAAWPFVEDATAQAPTSAPVIPAGQSRVVSHLAAPGTVVVDPLFAQHLPQSWAVRSQDGSQSNLFFSITNAGELLVTRGIEQFLREEDQVFTTLLELIAFNDLGSSGPQIITVQIVRAPVAPAAKPRILDNQSFTTTNLPGAAVGTVVATNTPQTWSLVEEINGGTAGSAPPRHWQKREVFLPSATRG